MDYIEIQEGIISFYRLHDSILLLESLDNVHKVDVIDIFKSDLEHIKINDLSKFMLIDFLQHAIIGNNSNTLNFKFSNNCSLSNIKFSVENDYFQRTFLLKD